MFSVRWFSLVCYIKPWKTSEFSTHMQQRAPVVTVAFRSVFFIKATSPKASPAFIYLGLPPIDDSIALPSIRI